MIKIIDFGVSDYKEILNLQMSLFEKLIHERVHKSISEEYVLIGEHYPVYTMGRRAKEENLLVPAAELENRGIKIYNIGRGGDITYHCEGQVILYPIINLERHKLGVKDYVNILEESVIRLLDIYGINGERVDGATGVWIGKGTPRERKICAIGIKCSRFCSMHGLALNVSSDLSGFSCINPCGFQDKGVTSIKKELLDKEVNLDINKIKKELLHIFLGLVFPFEEILNFPE